MSMVALDLDNGYTLSIIADVSGSVEVALLHDHTFVNTRYWYYTNIKSHDDYDDVVRYLDADKLVTALVKAKAYARGE